MYAAKFGTDEQKMMEKLWGDNFFDPATRKWTKKATDSKTCLRGFVQFCYNPIKQVWHGETRYQQLVFSHLHLLRNVYVRGHAMGGCLQYLSCHTLLQREPLSVYIACCLYLILVKYTMCAGMCTVLPGD